MSTAPSTTMTAEAIILETAAHYADNPPAKRALVTKGDCECLYLTPDGRMCALGRCLKDPKKFAHIHGQVETLVTKIKGDFRSPAEALDSILKPQYRGHPLKLWHRLQSFHDSPSNWTNTGLSVDGRRRLFDLLNEYHINPSEP